MDLERDGCGVSWRGLRLSTRIWFSTTLLATAVLCLLWSHWKLFWVDELLEYTTDTKPTFAAVFRGQLRAPFSLEPPAFHLLLHALHRVIPSAELASRLPSMAALLGVQICVFFLSLRWRGEQQQAVAAMLLPLVLVTVDYGPEARVYEVLTVCLAAALLSWQRAVSGRGARGWALTGLGVALGGAMLVHYYGVLAAVPLFAGEAVRTAQRRRVDWPVVLTLLAGVGCLLLDLPFERALAPFRLHYYATGETSWLKVPVTYSWFALHWWIYAKGARLLPLCMAAAIVLFGVALLQVAAAAVGRRKRGPVRMDAALLAAALLPIAGLVLAQVARAYVPRYSLPAVVGLAVLLPAVVFDYVRGHAARSAVCVLLLFAGAAYGTHQIVRAKREGAARMAELRSLPAQAEGAAGQPIYVQNLARFLVDRHYAPASVQKRLVAFDSQACELHWSGRDPSSLFAQNIAETTTMPVVDFARLTGDHAVRWMVVYHDPDEEWIWRELKQEGADVRRLGPALGGELLEVRFDGGRTCETEAPRRGPGTAAEQDSER